MDELLSWYNFDNRTDYHETERLKGLASCNGQPLESKLSCDKRCNYQDWMDKAIKNKQLSRSSSPLLVENEITDHQQNERSNEDSMVIPRALDLALGSSYSRSCGDQDDEDSNGLILCAWCQKMGSKVFSLRTANGFKTFCSELCFAQCRRASFKKNKVCDWCKHVRHTVNYVDFQDGEQSLQFCSDKCLNQYKMNIFCRETQAHLKAFSSVYRSSSPSASCSANHINNSSNNSEASETERNDNREGSLITPALWLKSSLFQLSAPSGSSLSSSSSSSSLSSSPRQSFSPPPAPVKCYGQTPPASENFQKSTFLCSMLPKCSQDTPCNVQASSSNENTDQTQSKESCKRPTGVLRQKISSKTKFSPRQTNTRVKSEPHSKDITCKQTCARRNGIKSNCINQKKFHDEPSLDSTDRLAEERSKTAPLITFTHPSNDNNLTPLLPQFPRNFAVDHQRQDKDSNGFNSNQNFPILPGQFLPSPHIRHPFLPSQPFLNPHQLNCLRLRYFNPSSHHSLPIFPFNPLDDINRQSTLPNLSGRRPPLLPFSNHPPFPYPPHLTDLHHPPVPLQNQSQAIRPTILNNPTSHPRLFTTPIPHPLFLPVPLPIPLPIPIPIRLDLKSSCKRMISTEDKAVQVDDIDKFIVSSASSDERTSIIISDNCNPKTKVNNLYRENTKFRIDTLLNKLIDKKMRSMKRDLETKKETTIDFNIENQVGTSSDVERSQEVVPITSNVEMPLEYDESSSSPCFLKNKRIKRDIKTN